MAGSGKDVEAVYRMLYPKPKPLLQYCRELVRHGELIYFSPNTNSTKPRYFFLFDTALLLTKRTGKKRYWLKVYVHLRNGVTLVDNGPTDTQFRLMVTVKGRTRPIIMYGKNQQHKELWVRDLKHVLWAANGKKGPDPSADSSSPAGGKRTQQPSAADRTSGKDSKSQRSGAGNSSGERTLYYQDAEDDFDEDDQREEDDSGDEEDEVEFMNVKKDDRRTQNMTNQDSGATGSNQQEVERLAHGLDSLVFDPFSDFIPPHASASVTTSPSYSVPSSTLATFPPVGAQPYQAYPQPTVTPFGPVAGPSFPAQGNPFAPVAPVAPLNPSPYLGAYPAAFDPNTSAPAMVPQQHQQQLLYQQQQHNIYLQQLHLQQQLQQLATIKQQYSQGDITTHDPFVVLAQREGDQH